MGKTSKVIKTATDVIATTAAVAGTIKENPTLLESLSQAYGRAVSAARSKSPKRRLDAKINAIETCARAVENSFPGTTEPADWRQRAQGLRLRTDLAWDGRRGRDRKRAIKELDEAATGLLEQINERLNELAATPRQPDIAPTPPTAAAISPTTDEPEN